jgi:bla regulator protein blaR1
MIYETMVEWLSWGWPLMIDHLWQATLFSMMVLVISRLLRRGPARARYALWLVASLKFVLPSALFIFVARQTRLSLSAFQGSSISSAEHLAAVSVIRPISSMGKANIIESVQRFDNLYLVLTIVWLIGFTLLTVLWWRRRTEFNRALKAGKPVTTGREAEALQRAQRRLGITRPIQLVLSPVLMEPGVCGTRRPVMVLPEGIAEHLSDDELEAVTMHEVAHVGRWDNAVSNLQMLLCCFLWFHPFVWLIDRRLLVERERACDEEVVKVNGGAGSYASGILKVCRFCLGWRVAGVSGMAGANLRQRIAQINSQRVNEKLRISHQLAVGFTAAFLIVFSVASADVGQQSRKGQAPVNSSGEMSKVPVRSSIPGGIDQEKDKRTTDQDASNVNSSVDARNNASQTQAPPRKDSLRETGEMDRVGPRSSSQRVADGSIGQRSARLFAQGQEREISQADINELTRKAMAERLADADEANIVVVVNKNKQVSTTRTESKIIKP